VTLVRIETPRGHRYEMDGHPVPGVTTLLNQGLPKPALTRWAARTVAEYVADQPERIESLRDMGRGSLVAALARVPWTARDRAAVKGTDVHDLAAQLVGGEEVEVPGHLTGHVESYLRWLDEWQPVPLLTEAPVGHRVHWWAGTLDSLVLMDGANWLIDIKTGSGVYPEAALQLAAYSGAEFAVVDGVEVPLPAVDHLAVLHVREDGYDLVPVAERPGDRDWAYQTFRHIAWVASCVDRMKSLIGAPIGSRPDTAEAVS